jgi:hypothetical protein
MKLIKKTSATWFLVVLTLVVGMAQGILAQDFNYNNDFKSILNKTKDKSSEYYYPTLLDRFNKNDETLTELEMIALQIGFTADKNYKPYSTIDQEREILKLTGDKDYNKALKACDQLLKKNPVNLTALMEQGFAASELGKPEGKELVDKAKKVIASILWSGDGSYDRPYFVLGPMDGQIIIRYIFGNSIGTMGSGSDAHGNFLDILEMETEGKKENVYFVIQHAVDKMFSE